MADINPMDFLLWLSEELETRDWDSASVGTQLGLAMNFVFLLARANSGSSSPSDDIFSDETSSGWLSFLVSSRLLGRTAVYHVEANRMYCKDLSAGMGPHSFLFHQCFLHDYANAQVSTLSGQGRQAAFDAFCTTCESEPIERIAFDAPELSRKSDNTRICRVASPPRQDIRCLGVVSLGSSASVLAPVLSLWPWACFDVHDLPSSSSSRPPTKCDGFEYTHSAGPCFCSASLLLFSICATSKG